MGHETLRPRSASDSTSDFVVVVVVVAVAVVAVVAVIVVVIESLSKMVSLLVGLLHLQLCSQLTQWRHAVYCALCNAKLQLHVRGEEHVKRTLLI